LREPRQSNDIDRSVDALLEAQGSSKLHVVRPPSDSIRRALQLLNEEISSRPPGYTQSVRGLTLKLLLDGARAMTEGVVSEQAEPAVRSAAQAIVRIAVRYLRDNLARPIEVRDVAAQVHLSERHLSRLFHKEMDTSILDHLTSLRIERASQLLLDK